MKPAYAFPVCGALLAASLVGVAGDAPGDGPAPGLRFVFDMVHHNPGEPLFETKYNDPQVLRAKGYNGQVIKAFPQAALTYDKLDPSLMPQGSPQRKWAEDYGRFIDGRLAAAKAAGIPVFNFTDVLVVPETLLLKYFEEMTVGSGEITKKLIEENRVEAIHGSMHGTDRRISILKPMTRKVVLAQIDELFTRFPDLSGIFVRFGETYLHDTPFHVGGSPVGGGAEEHRALINLLREEVCVKRGKMVFYRTWGWDGFLTDPAYYASIVDSIEPHPNLLFSIKHSQGDFTRDVPFNKTLGIGRHPQLVEVSCSQGGLYGKNSHPYYMGKGVIDGWSQWNAGMGDTGLRSLVGNPRFAGVWTWTRGDGWAGPYPPNEFWVDLNAFVINRFGRDPRRSEEDIFREYVRDHLKIDAARAAKFRELCLLATRATWHVQESSFHPATSWWCRDDGFTELDLSALVEGGLEEKALLEKTHAISDWKRVEVLAREVGLPDKEDQEFLEVSATYGRIKMEIITEIWKMQMLAAARARTGKPDPVKMAEALKTYDAKWAEWRALKERHACCPSLYNDNKRSFYRVPFAKSLATYRRWVAEGGATPSKDR